MSDLTSKVSPVADFDWDAYENGDSLVNVSKEDLEKKYDQTLNVVKDKDVVWVKLDTDGRKAILGDVVVRVSDKFARAMHIDTDESNAVGASGNLMGEIVKL